MLVCVYLRYLRGSRADINEAFLSMELSKYNKPLTWLITALLPLCSRPASVGIYVQHMMQQCVFLFSEVPLLILTYRVVLNERI